MNCHICKGESHKMFTSKILNKYDISYFQCSKCKFIQTEEPYWLNEAYASAIGLLDVGLIYRNIYLSKLTEPILKKYFNYKGTFLDYGGGYGMFVRLMRDLGFNFYRQDKYCDNLFAKYFDLTDIQTDYFFELVTAFEVFEHLSDPGDQLEEFFSYTDSVLFSTELQPEIPFKSINDWWYFAPEGGQHVSFYTKQSLEVLAKKFDCHLYTNNKDLHLITRRKLMSDPFVIPEQIQVKQNFLYKLLKKIIKKLERPSRKPDSAIYLESLLMKDFEYYKTKIN